MGWNNWYTFGCNVSEQLMKDSADAMVSSGMAAVGYNYVNLDDCWAAPSRDAQGNLVADPIKFPNGMKTVADYIHSKGLKMGIYTDVGSTTCAGYPGSYTHEYQDAATFASWGIDFVKVDWCNNPSNDAAGLYGTWRDAIAASGRAMVFSICNWSYFNPWDFGPTTGNMWRTYGDINDSWTAIINDADATEQHPQAAGPGGWNDPDILQVGRGAMTNTEYTTHFSLWAMLSAPLLAGNDIRTMSQATKDILMNTEVIAVDQDPAGKQGQKVKDNNSGLQVWSKRLQAPGTRAVLLYNRTGSSASITANWSDLGFTNNSVASVRNLWTHTDLGNFTNSYTATVPSHGVVMLKMTGTDNPSYTQFPLKTGYLSDQLWTYANGGWGPVEKNLSLGNIDIRDGVTLRLNRTNYSKGLGTHAASEIRYNTNGTCSNFSSSIGLDDEVGSLGSVVFQVYGDGVKLYESGTMTGNTNTKNISLNISGKKELKLIVTNAGDSMDYDHADWANARVTCQ